MRIHRNLHNAKSSGPQWVHTVSGKVESYLERITLVGVSTRIQPAGQRKCAEAGVRSVCAFLDGDLAAADRIDTGTWHRVSYDPRVNTEFRSCSDGSGITYPWNRAEAVRLDSDGSSWVLNPTWEV
jgi:hypothetical protein